MSATPIRDALRLGAIEAASEFIAPTMRVVRWVAKRIQTAFT